MKKTHVNSNVDLNTLAGGAFAEKVNEALVQVGENIQNQNTEATKKRKITITMTFAPNKTRQLVNTQIGITTKQAALVPNPVHLVPYRTFLEVEQPASDFVFRISEGRGGEPVFKLVAADGGLWKAEAVDNIKKYLEDALDGIENREQITIIA